MQILMTGTGETYENTKKLSYNNSDGVHADVCIHDAGLG